MVLVFSGTGNSRFVAEHLADLLGDALVDLNGRMKSGDTSPLQSDKPYVLVCPIYAWRTPRIVEEHLRKTDLRGSKDLYVLYTTCGSSGDADRYAAKYASSIGMTYKGSCTFFMVGNYIAFMQNPDERTAAYCNGEALRVLPEVVSIIQQGKELPHRPATAEERMYSDVANPMFYRTIFNRQGFYATDDCIGCGTCVTVCPVNNIVLKGASPTWEGPCLHCMACIHRCPTAAIEFRDITKGKNRYYNVGKLN